MKVYGDLQRTLDSLTGLNSYGLRGLGAVSKFACETSAIEAYKASLGWKTSIYDPKALSTAQIATQMREQSAFDFASERLKVQESIADSMRALQGRPELNSLGSLSGSINPAESFADQVKASLASNTAGLFGALKDADALTAFGHSSATSTLTIKTDMEGATDSIAAVMGRAQIDALNALAGPAFASAAIKDICGPANTGLFADLHGTVSATASTGSIADAIRRNAISGLTGSAQVRDSIAGVSQAIRAELNSPISGIARATESLQTYASGLTSTQSLAEMAGSITRPMTLSAMAREASFMLRDSIAGVGTYRSQPSAWAIYESSLRQGYLSSLGLDGGNGREAWLQASGTAAEKIRLADVERLYGIASGEKTYLTREPTGIEQYLARARLNEPEEADQDQEDGSDIDGDDARDSLEAGTTSDSQDAGLIYIPQPKIALPGRDLFDFVGGFCSEKIRDRVLEATYGDAVQEYEAKMAAGDWQGAQWTKIMMYLLMIVLPLWAEAMEKMDRVVKRR